MKHATIAACDCGDRLYEAEVETVVSALRTEVCAPRITPEMNAIRTFQRRFWVHLLCHSTNYTFIGRHTSTHAAGGT